MADWTVLVDLAERVSMPELQIRDERDLVNVASKPSALYEKIALTSLTAYSLYWIQQWQLRRSIEAIAVLNWRLFPDKFAMVGFPEYPDAFRTNRSLLQGQPKYRNILTGAASKGFSLNDRGLDVALELNEVLGVPTSGEGHELGRIERRQRQRNPTGVARSIEPEREVKRIRASKLFDKWKNGVMGERDLIHVHAMLGIFDHTPTKLRTKAMRDLEKSAAELGDAEVQSFLRDVVSTFPQALISKTD
jgi:hypothetical protein